MAGSNPPSTANRSARTRVHPPGAQNTSRTASCCSWSSSPRSTIGARTPGLVGGLADATAGGSGRPTRPPSGVTMPAFDRNASSTMARTAVGAERDVVVAEDVEGRALDELEHLVGGRAEAALSSRRRT